MTLFNQLKNKGYNLTLTCNEYRQGKEMVTLPKNQVLHYDVFFTEVKNVNAQIIIEVLCAEKVPQSFRVQLRVPDLFRVVDTWKKFEPMIHVKPILENIEELKREMKRELIEIDCI